MAQKQLVCKSCGSTEITKCEMIFEEEKPVTRYDCDSCGRTVQLIRHANGFGQDDVVTVGDVTYIRSTPVVH